MKKDLDTIMKEIALETMHATQDDELFLSVGEWYASLSASDQALLEQARKNQERTGRGYQLLLREESLRLKTIEKKLRFRK